jgi:hypothetical protein
VAYPSLHEQMAKARAFLVGKGFKDEQIRTSSVGVAELAETEHVGTGEERVERRVFKGYQMTQAVTIRSTDVPKIERISREITDLLDQGVSIESSAPAYFYTKLGELKIEMLAEASKDARTRADNIVKSAGGGRIGKLLAADMGVINVNPANSTETSWEGNSDTSSLEKDIITIVHIRYRLD